MTMGAELRQDLITGKWVVIAPARAQRPHTFGLVQTPRTALPLYEPICPFCDLERFPQAAPTLLRPAGTRWKVRAFPNKFPAFIPAHALQARKVGLYTVMDAVGFHEIILVRPHNGTMVELSDADLKLYVWAWRERYRELMRVPSVSYIQLIENHGSQGGGSLTHPHMQLFAIPIIPSDEVLDLLRGAEAYAEENGSCAYCDMLAHERDGTTRLVWENEQFIVLCPFAPRAPHEQWVLPRAHASGFESLTDEQLPAFAEALRQALRRLRDAFHDPGYNLFVYTTPCDTEGLVSEPGTFGHFHWHVQILPRLAVWGGFELATGLEVHSALPEESAECLRSL